MRTASKLANVEEAARTSLPAELVEAALEVMAYAVEVTEVAEAEGHLPRV